VREYGGERVSFLEELSLIEITITVIFRIGPPFTKLKRQNKYAE
jgi:hypothetical protein